MIKPVNKNFCISLNKNLQIISFVYFKSQLLAKIFFTIMQKLLEKCNNNPEILRKRLIKSKNWVLFSDLVISVITLGSLGFLNNYLTKKRTGKSGFSAELKMADPKIIEQRADEYEKNKKRYKYFIGRNCSGINLGPFSHQ